MDGRIMKTPYKKQIRYKFNNGKITHKRCAACFEFKSVNLFGIKNNLKSKLNVYCKNCQHVKYDHKRTIYRKKVLEHYGNKCKCCGEKNIEFLTIDHINGKGNEHRRLIKKRSNSFYRWLIKNNFPKSPPLRILCWNCNRSYGTYGYCPHQKK